MVDFATFPGTNNDLTQVQENVKTALNELNRVPLLEGKALQADLVASSDNKIRHNLGRMPLNYILTSATQPEHPTYVSSDREFITLNNSAAAVNTVRLWVF